MAAQALGLIALASENQREQYIKYHFRTVMEWLDEPRGDIKRQSAVCIGDG